MLMAANLGAAQSFNVLYSFGGSGEPQMPQSSMTQGLDGNLYGTTPLGGQDQDGTTFGISVQGTPGLVYSFTGTSGLQPYGGLTLAADGNFYGTASGGGTSNCGIIFRITNAGNLQVLYNFTCGSDGGSPYARPIQGTDGNLYGTTTAGGANSCGTIYQLTSSGQLNVIHNFVRNQGYFTPAPLIQGVDGNLYGTTESGGYGSGAVFSVSTSGKFNTLYTFSGSDGAAPQAPLVQANNGIFYGTTSAGGIGFGTVFQITPSGQFQPLHNFNQSDGALPLAGLIQGTDGYLYGTTDEGGTADAGVIFRMTMKGKIGLLYSFDGNTAANPEASLVQDTDGTFFGTSQLGGSQSDGTFFSFSMGLQPFVQLVPNTGLVGASSFILGQGLSGATAVQFGGVPAEFNILSDTSINVTVPGGALSGTVVVKTPGGRLTSNQAFRVLPQIKSFSPSRGTIGTPVTINGVSLTQTTQVTFGGAPSLGFLVESDTQVLAIVPVGAKTGKIGITTFGGSTLSSTVFTVVNKNRQ